MVNIANSSLYRCDNVCPCRLTVENLLFGIRANFNIFNMAILMVKLTELSTSWWLIISYLYARHIMSYPILSESTLQEPSSRVASMQIL
jgi:hypothetical protein